MSSCADSLMHVLPLGFHRIRHFGLIANNGRKEKLALARQLLNVVTVSAQVATADAANDEPVRLNFVCRHCSLQPNDRGGVVHSGADHSRTTVQWS